MQVNQIKAVIPVGNRLFLSLLLHAELPSSIRMIEKNPPLNHNIFSKALKVNKIHRLFSDIRPKHQ